LTSSILEKKKKNFFVHSHTATLQINRSDRKGCLYLCFLKSNKTGNASTKIIFCRDCVIFVAIQKQ